MYLVQVNALNKNTAPFHVRAAPTKPVIQPRATAVPEAPAPVSNNVVENNNDPAGYFSFGCIVFEYLVGTKMIFVTFVIMFYSDSRSIVSSNSY